MGYMIWLVIISLILTFFIMILEIVLSGNKNKKPREYKKIDNEIIVNHSGDNIRDGYSKKKIPQNLDAIVIGSGIGGLTTAALLSKVGKKVLVLEQHYIAGGCTHAFEDHGYEFDTGIHYVGNIKKRKKILDLITTPNIEWDQMGVNDRETDGTYDEITVGTKRYKFRAGKQNFIDDLVKIFPEEKEAIEKYVEL